MSREYRWREITEPIKTNKKKAKPSEKAKGVAELLNCTDGAFLAVMYTKDDPDKKDDWSTDYDKHMIKLVGTQSSGKSGGSAEYGDAAVLSIEVDVD